MIDKDFQELEEAQEQEDHALVDSQMVLEVEDQELEHLWFRVEAQLTLKVMQVCLMLYTEQAKVEQLVPKTENVSPKKEEFHKP